MTVESRGGRTASCRKAMGLEAAATRSEAPHVRPDTIKIVADSVGISKLSDEVASALSPDVEYRMREIIQVRFCVAHLAGLVSC